MKAKCIILLLLAVTLVTQAQQTPVPFRAGDRLHPDNDGNMLMAYLFLKAQGLAGKPVAAIRIDAKGRKVKQQENCYISNLEVNQHGGINQ